MVTVLPMRSSLPPQVQRSPGPIPTTPPRQPSLFSLASPPDAVLAPVELAADGAMVAAARSLVLAVVEVIQGRRPGEQLVRWVSEEPLADLIRHARAVRRHRAAQPRIASVHVQPVTPLLGRPRAAEVSVRLVDAQRSRAVALRIEHRRGRWVCVCLEFGP